MLVISQPLIERQHTAAKATFDRIKMRYQDLVESIRDDLACYRYTEPPEELSLYGASGVVLATPRRKMVRNVCIVMDLPDECASLSQARFVHHRIRNHLTQMYAQFPYLKELGTYVIMIGSRKLFLALQDNIREFKDKTGFHMNVMLGTVVVDRERYLSCAAATWGLVSTGKHFETITATVREWCKNMQGEQTAVREVVQSIPEEQCSRVGAHHREEPASRAPPADDSAAQHFDNAPAC